MLIVIATILLRFFKTIGVIILMVVVAVAICFFLQINGVEIPFFPTAVPI